MKYLKDNFLLLCLIIGILLPIIFFGIVIIFKNQQSDVKPQYSFIYSSSDYNKPYNCNLKLTLANNALSLITDLNNTDTTQSYSCSDTYYYYDIQTQSSKILTPTTIGSYTALSASPYDTSKDPDGFEFSNYRYDYSPLPFFNNYNYSSNQTYYLSRSFAQIKLKIVEQNARLVTFTKSTN
jgi:hypothetical protein